MVVINNTIHTQKPMSFEYATQQNKPTNFISQSQLTYALTCITLSSERPGWGRPGWGRPGWGKSGIPDAPDALTIPGWGRSLNNNVIKGETA